MNKILVRFLSFIVLMLSLSVQAQTYKQQELKTKHITGTVLCSSDQTPIVGATVIVKGTTNGAAVDFDGNFTIHANLGDILLISSIGFTSKEIKVTEQNHYHLTLDTDNVSLTEIAVIGYGVQERRDLTGAVTSINVEALEQPALSIDNALAGQVAGVQINSSSGTPGSATAITIRGITSLAADNNPLFIIDGVPVYGAGGFSKTSFAEGSVPMIGIGGNSASGQIGANSEFERNPLSNLNMDDIASIEILKDAYATAIYGSRGAAGVILITTKKGKKGQPKVNLNISTLVAEPVGVPDVLNGDEYVDFYNGFEAGLNKPKGINIDWFDKATRTAITNNVSATVSAGTDKSTYFLSLSYLDMDSYIINNDFKRYTARINYEYKSSEKFRFGNNLTFSYTDNNSLNSAQVYRNSIIADPSISVKDEEGNYNFVENKQNDRFNPIAKAKEDINYVRDRRLIGNLYAEYKALPWLTLRSEFGIDMMVSKAYNRNMAYEQIDKEGDANQTNVQNMKYVFNNTASIYKEFGEHVFNGVIGQSFETSDEDFTRIGGTGFPTNDVLSISQADNSSVYDAVRKEWAMMSFFARMNYRWLDKYMAGVTYRVDGSSRFNKNERYVGFPSFSLGWRFSKEQFLEAYTWLTDAKLRASLGYSGISGSGGYYGHQGQYVLKQYASKYGITNILEVDQPSNPDLKWERTKTFDLGLDVTLFGDKVQFTFDYYNKKSVDMLIQSAVPLYSGYSGQQQNLVDMTNKGIEFSLSTLNINKEFKWSTNLNIAKNTNEVTNLNLDGSYKPGGAETGYAFYQVGESATAWFLYDWHSVDPLTGNPLWKYADGTISNTPPASVEGNATTDNKMVMGDRLPEFTGGITNVFSYKNFELNTMFAFSYGGKIMNGTRAELLTYTDQRYRNLSRDILDEWIIAGHKTDIPKKNNTSIIKSGYGGGYTDYTVSRESDRFLEDGSFIRLKNISLTYRFNPEQIRKFGLRSLALYLKGSNLITWTNYSGPDPEVSAFGSSATYAGNDELTIPQQKSIQIGVKIGL